jgi:hypothetical protein
MPKRKRREHIPHKFINTIEHKHCGKCDQWKLLDQFAKYGNGKQSCCKACDNKRRKQHNKVMKEKLKNERDKAPTGFLVCLRPSCKKGLQPVDQFIGEHVRDEEPTDSCKTCRKKEKEARIRREAPCQKVWDDWRREHPCVICNQDPEHVHNPLLIEADHLPEFIPTLGVKLKACSEVAYWSHSQRGVPELQAELTKCEALCRFHHALQTQQRDHVNGRIQTKPCILRRRAIINAEKHKRKCCSNPKCNRVLKKGEERAFDFDHRDPNTKFMYNGKRKDPSQFVRLPQALFATQWPLEQAKCDLLCANCHALKTKGNRDGYKI